MSELGLSVAEVEPVVVDPGLANVVLLVAWATAGVVATLVIGRRGQGMLAYALLGVVFGPLMIPVLHERRQVAEHRADPIRLSPGRPGAGPVDVLVGVAGDAEPRELLDHAVTVFGGRLGRVTLAWAVDVDAVGPGRHVGAAERAALELETAALLSSGCEPATVLLPGRPGPTLARFASDEGCHVILVGAHLARALPRKGPTAVLVPPDQRHRPAPATDR